MKRIQEITTERYFNRLIGLVCVVFISVAIGESKSHANPECPIPAADSQVVAKPDRRAFPRTLNELFSECDVVLIGSRIEQSEETASDTVTTFNVKKIFKGKPFFPKTQFELPSIKKEQGHDQFLFMGNLHDEKVQWTFRSELKIEDEPVLQQIFLEKPNHSKRLEYYLHQLEHMTPWIADNAHLEFALSSDEDVIALKDKLDHDQLVRWVRNPDVPRRRLRLYFAMLSICQDDSDTEWLESTLKNFDREKVFLMDGWITHYLMLKGEAGLALIDRLFLGNGSADYLDTFSAVESLRFFASLKNSTISKNRIADSLRLVLEQPRMADIVINDLAELKDWSSVHRISELFRSIDEQSQWVRVPAIMFMDACPLDEAKKYLAEFKTLDPRAFKRAKFFMGSTGKIEPNNPKTSPEKAEIKLMRPHGRSSMRRFLC